VPVAGAACEGEGSTSDTEAWRDEENAPRVGRSIGRANVDDSVADVQHTSHRTRSRVGSRGPTLVVNNAPLRIVSYIYRRVLSPQRAYRYTPRLNMTSMWPFAYVATCPLRRFVRVGILHVPIEALESGYFMDSDEDTCCRLGVG
jgi:hypothetical protein